MHWSINRIVTNVHMHRGVRITFAIFSGLVALGFATVGGAVSSAPNARQFQPDSQFPLVAFDMSTDGPEIDPADIAGETILFKSLPMQALAKSDRMTLPVRLALAGPARDLVAPIDPGAPHRLSYSVVTEPGRENETFVTPNLTLASLGIGDGGPYFDLPAPMQAGPTRPTETPEIAEEEDDAPPTALSVPLPHAKPILDPSLPLPKMRPELPPVSTTQNPGRIPASKPNVLPQPGEIANPDAVGAIPMRQPPKPSSILAFLSPPSDAPQPGMAPPMSQPPGTILTPTPFGIPYVLQTQTVDTACLKPELLDILRQVETHYGRKVVVTSGYRSRGREGSLHRTCRAADIIVPGVSSQALAAYARSISAVGGVGTYCHQSMIHVDIGTPRDWKYGCGSYFAMRNGTAHWGKIPQDTQED